MKPDDIVPTIRVRIRPRAWNVLTSNGTANALVALTCVVVLSVILARPDAPTPTARENVWLAGSTAPPEILAASDSQPLRRVLVFVHSRCRYCAAEMPFYLELFHSGQKAGGFRVVFAGAEDEGVLRGYLAEHGLADAPVFTFATIPGLRATPTIIVLESDGRVAGSWQGVLSSRQKADLRKLL